MSDEKIQPVELTELESVAGGAMEKSDQYYDIQCDCGTTFENQQHLMSERDGCSNIIYAVCPTCGKKYKQ